METIFTDFLSSLGDLFFFWFLFEFFLFLLLSFWIMEFFSHQSKKLDVCFVMHC